MVKLPYPYGTKTVLLGIQTENVARYKHKKHYKDKNKEEKT